MRTLLLAICLAAAGWALPQPQPVQFRLGPALAYSYSFETAEQTRQEERDALGNVRGSYSVRYPGGGLLTQRYSFPRRLPVFRTTTAGPLGPVGTLVSLRRAAPFENSKVSTFLIEMLEQRLDSRAPPVITKTEAVLVEALPVFTNSKVSPALVAFRLEKEADGLLGQQELQLRDPGDAVVVEAAADPAAAAAAAPAAFVNSKESSALRVFRLQSLREGLAGRAPPLVGPEEVIVEAASSA